MYNRYIPTAGNDERTKKMIVGIALKAAKSKAARKVTKKVARKAVKYVRENVTAEISDRGLEINFADRTLRIERV